MTNDDKGGKMLDIKEYLKQTKTVLLTQDAFDELMQMAYAQPIRCKACRWRDDYGHWLGCPVLNTDDDNFCSMAERRTDEGD